jgi:type II secretory pathway component HofQ
MRIRNLLIIFAAFTLALTSCSKHSDSGSGSHAKQSDLGIVQVSNGEKTRHVLKNGQICTILPTVSADGTILLDMFVERDGQVISRPRIQTKSGIPAAIESGEVNIAITPVIKQ